MSGWAFRGGEKCGKVETGCRVVGMMGYIGQSGLCLQSSVGLCFWGDTRKIPQLQMVFKGPGRCGKNAAKNREEHQAGMRDSLRKDTSTVTVST